MKNFKELIAQLAEAQVSTNKYSWGTMKTVHDGSKTSYPLHPEHQAIVKRLHPSGEHAKAMYKDETGAQVHVHREGDKVHFVSHKKSGSHKTTVDYKHFDEEVDNEVKEGYYEKPASAYRRKGDEVRDPTPVAPVPDRKYIKGTPENKALRAKNKPINGHPTNVKEEAELKKEGFFHMVGRKQIAAAKGAIKGFKEQTDLTEQDREDGDYSIRHTVVAHVSDNTGTPADGEKRAVVKKALSVLAATPKHAEKAAHKHFSDKGYKVHKLSAVIAKQAPAMQKEEAEQIKEASTRSGADVDRKLEDHDEDTHGSVPEGKPDHTLHMHNGMTLQVHHVKHPNGKTKHTMVTSGGEHENAGTFVIPGHAHPHHILSSWNRAHKEHDDDGYGESFKPGLYANINGHPTNVKEDLDEARMFASHQEAEAAAAPGQKPKLDPASNKYVLVRENKGLDVSKVAHAGDTPHEEDWTTVQKKKNIPFDGPYNKSAFKKKNNPNRTGTDAARALAQRGMPKEETEGNPMKSYAEFVQDLQEIKLADLPSRKVTGTSYGAQYHDPEGDDDADNKKPAKAADAPKRGRGRPAGAMSGARQQGSAKQRKTGGVDYTGYKLHLPNTNK
jgi:hypothetical protein